MGATIESRKQDLIDLFGGKPIDITQQSGLYIWRIENSRPNPINESERGIFYTRDAYIVLYSNLEEENNNNNNNNSGEMKGASIHMWIGKEATTDKTGIAAIRTVELNSLIQNKGTHYREVMN